MYKYLLIICLVICFVVAVKAQQPDTIGKKSKTDKEIRARLDSAKANPIVPKVKERVWHPDSNHSPHKAIIRSMEIPGWGQVYNHQIWKVPLIYGGLATFVSFYIYNQSNYSVTLKIAKDRELGKAPAPGDSEYNLYNTYQSYNVSTAAINDAVTGYKRNEELDIFAFVGVWGLQVIDAYIEAKFQHVYSMDNNLTLKVNPTLINQGSYATNLSGSFIPGLKLTFAIR